MEQIKSDDQGGVLSIAVSTETIVSTATPVAATTGALNSGGQGGVLSVAISTETILSTATPVAASSTNSAPTTSSGPVGSFINIKTTEKSLSDNSAPSRTAGAGLSSQKHGFLTSTVATTTYPTAPSAAQSGKTSINAAPTEGISTGDAIGIGFGGSILGVLLVALVVWRIEIWNRRRIFREHDVEPTPKKR